MDVLAFPPVSKFRKYSSSPLIPAFLVQLCVFMQGKNKERWLELCEKAAVEQDGDKLVEQVAEINRLLVEKETRLAKLRTAGERKRERRKF